MKKIDKTGPFYEAPSTAFENLGSPSLEIRSEEELLIQTLSECIPERLYLVLKMVPIFLNPIPNLTLHIDESDFPVLLSDTAPLMAIDFIEGGDHDVLFKGIRQPLYSSLPYTLKEEEGVLSRFTFHTPFKSSFSMNHTPHPYGGSWDEAPNRCEQLFFALTLKQNKAFVQRVSFGEKKSLTTALYARELKVNLTFEGTTIPYYSVYYEAVSPYILLIHFIP